MNDSSKQSQRKIHAVRPLDVFIALLFITGSIFFFPAFTSNMPATVHILRDGTVVAHYPLSVDQRVCIPGRYGQVSIAISEGRALIEHASCPRHICMQSAPISKPGQQIVCVPNHIAVEIRNSEKSSIDAVAR